jgi:type I restriction enzyme M protein
LTFLLFLKMADGQSRPPFSKASPIPKGFDLVSLLAKAVALSVHREITGAIAAAQAILTS